MKPNGDFLQFKMSSWFHRWKLLPSCCDFLFLTRRNMSACLCSVSVVFLKLYVRVFFFDTYEPPGIFPTKPLSQRHCLIATLASAANASSVDMQGFFTAMQWWCRVANVWVLLLAIGHTFADLSNETTFKIAGWQVKTCILPHRVKSNIHGFATGHMLWACWFRWLNWRSDISKGHSMSGGYVVASCQCDIRGNESVILSSCTLYHLRGFFCVWPKAEWIGLSFILLMLCTLFYWFCHDLVLTWVATLTATHRHLSSPT